MVKKLKKTAEQATAAATDAAGKAAKTVAGLMDNQLANAVKESAQQIWLAGMGAFSKAQDERGKLFETLVKEGINLQKKTQGLAEDKINEVTGRMSAMAGTVSAKAGQNWDKLETIFEARTAKAMNKLGVPTAKDVAALTQRVDELAAAVARLSKATGVAAPRKASAKASVKAAAQPVKAVKALAKAPVKRARKAAAAA